MPWIKSNIDLSFPEIKKVQLEEEQRPSIEQYYPLAYLRRREDLAINKNRTKVTNALIDSAEQFQEYTMNLLKAKCQKLKNTSSQIEISAGYGKSVKEDANPALRNPEVLRKSLKPVRKALKEPENTGLLIPERTSKFITAADNQRSRSVIPMTKYSLK